MSQRVIISCDVEGCGSTEAKSVLIPVVFVTEQTEGRSMDPHLVRDVKLDMCDACAGHMVSQRELLTAAGAQGHNRYWFTSRKG